MITYLLIIFGVWIPVATLVFHIVYSNDVEIEIPNFWKRQLFHLLILPVWWYGIVTKAVEKNVVRKPFSGLAKVRKWFLAS